ncbi:MAG: sortase [Patescibacteria group bacterium]
MPPSKRIKIKKNNENQSSRYGIFFYLGIGAFLTGLLLLLFIFYPIAREEFRYTVRQAVNDKSAIKPVDYGFGIVIPKIAANAKVIANVDPFNQKTYQTALTMGVAHAAGTAFPGHAGNTFIFAHSSVDWYTANRYNSVFYLLYKLEKGDEVDVYFEDKKFVYRVKEKKFVNPEEIFYLDPITKDGGSTMTLMTCWPPGTSLKRLVVLTNLQTLPRE